MIVFDLKCAHQHIFEVWFRSSADYERQKINGLLSCPICGDQDIKKSIMAPNVSLKSNQKPDGHQPAGNTQSDNVNNNAAGESSGVKKSEITTPNSIGAPPQTPKVSIADMPPAYRNRLEEIAGELTAKITTHIEQNFENVGDEFANEARKIHYGDSDERGIYGSASQDDVDELLEEGIDILPLPKAPKPQVN